MHRLLTALAVAALFAGTLPGHGQSAADFFRGKQIRFVLGAAPGQDYDVWARFLARHLPRHVPGSPSFVVQNMPGAGHMLATNWLYNIALRDGTVWGSVSRNIPSAGILQLPGARYDPVKFNWLGSPEITNRGCYAMARSRVKTGEDLLEHELVVGGTGAGSTVTETPKLLRGLLGMKFKVVEGYVKPQDAQFAMESGELDGLCTTAQSFRNFRPDWIKSGVVRVLFTLEREPVSWLDAPTVYKFVKTQEQRLTLDFFSSSIELGRPLLLPPEVPPERVEALRRAFDATLKDSGCIEKMQTARIEFNPITGEELTRIVARTMQAPKSVTDRYKAAITGD
jgi:tripartite-type tricarboxylate transporter receptor subunit TctC